MDAGRDGGVTVRYAPGPRERELLRRAARAGQAPQGGGRGADRAPRDPAARVARAGRSSPGSTRSRRARRVQPRAAVHGAPDVVPDRPAPGQRGGPGRPGHGVRGLWVTDSCAMPSATGVNPKLSLMALAHRTAMRMAAAS